MAHPKIICLILLLLAVRTTAQTTMTGEIDYAQLGISFTVPDGWQAQEGDGLVFIGSEKVSGLILISMHEFGDLNDMMLSIESGFSEDGMELFAGGSTRVVGDDAVVTEYIGQIEGEPAKGRGMGRLNPYGNSVSIIAIALERTWSDLLEKAAMDLMSSVTFRKVARQGPTLEQWERHLTHVRLSRIEGNGPGPSAEGGADGAAGRTQQLDLCKSWFTYSISDPAKEDPAAITGSATGAPRGSGSWNVLEDQRGRVLLRLDHADGQRREYVLEEQEGRTYLDGQRWFRTWDGEHAPDCE